MFYYISYYGNALFFSTKFLFSFFLSYFHIILLSSSSFLLLSYIPIIGPIFSFSVYWISLGILSSIGIGSGLNTGLLFLIPFTFNNIHNISLCLSAGYLWGFGSALGEIPPYFLAKYKSHNFSSLISPSSYLYRVNLFMVYSLQHYGFFAILFFASYPNMFFDLCGILCGLFNFPFYKFFIPTLLGKSLIRISLQTSLISYSLSHSNRLSSLLLSLFSPSSPSSPLFSYFFYFMLFLFFLQTIDILSIKYKSIHNII